MPNGLLGRAARARRYEPHGCCRAARLPLACWPTLGALAVVCAAIATTSACWRSSALAAIVGVGLNVLLGLTGPGLARARRLLRHRRLCGRRSSPPRPAWASGWRCRRRRPSPASRARCSPCRRMRVRGPYLAMMTIAFGFIVGARLSSSCVAHRRPERPHRASPQPAFGRWLDARARRRCWLGADAAGASGFILARPRHPPGQGACARCAISETAAERSASIRVTRQERGVRAVGRLYRARRRHVRLLMTLRELRSPSVLRSRSCSCSWSMIGGAGSVLGP